MNTDQIEGWRNYFTSEIQTRYGVEQGDARRGAEALVLSLFEGNEGASWTAPRENPHESA